MHFDARFNFKFTLRQLNMTNFDSYRKHMGSSSLEVQVLVHLCAANSWLNHWEHFKWTTFYLSWFFPLSLFWTTVANMEGPEVTFLFQFGNLRDMVTVPAATINLKTLKDLACDFINSKVSSFAFCAMIDWHSYILDCGGLCELVSTRKTCKRINKDCHKRSLCRYYACAPSKPTDPWLLFGFIEQLSFRYQRMVWATYRNVCSCFVMTTKVQIFCNWWIQHQT